MISFDSSHMAQRDAIVSFCSKLLRSDEIVDEWCANGLQIEGKAEVVKIALGVSTTVGFLSQAAEWNADMCLVHHGLFWRKGVIRISGVLKKRLELLLSKNMSLVNYHIPLDAHPEIGNNAYLIRLLDLKQLEVVECGFMAELSEALSFEQFSELIRNKIGPINFSGDFAGKPVKRIGVISGGAASFAPAVAAAGADTFLFGEITEHDYHDLKELGLSFIAAGHFATERFGVQELGKKIAAQFPEVEVRFFDENCPV